MPLQEISSLLVVDDSQTQREHALRLARELGIACLYEAADGAEALRLLGMLKLPPSLMLIDLEMPGMDGVELMEAMARQGIDVPFIVASSRDLMLLESVDTMARTLGLEVQAVLQKPLTIEALRPVLMDIATGLDGGAARRAAAPVSASIAPPILALAIERGEIVVHYQPKVDIRTGLLRGVEALARWASPELGAITPDRFIGVAEACGLIHPLTLSVTDQALAQAARWNARGLRLSVAINLSPRLLDQAALVHEIDGMVRRHGVQAEQVVFEITESSLASGLGSALAVMARLRLKGFGLSIDDYGTGFSSMAQLARVPFTELKIDRSFVNGATRRKQLRVMLQSALDMARRLDLVTVAEGVETLEDWRLLQSFGCNTGQGWLIARAMPGEALQDWLRGHRARLDALRMPADVASAANPA
jgi:EAL domain-containing protein (putative c-di-GMP-specific phosphodiesterase class I)